MTPDGFHWLALIGADNCDVLHVQVSVAKSSVRIVAIGCSGSCNKVQNMTSLPNLGHLLLNQQEKVI